jgi:DNA polymerase III subunit chi
VGTVNFYQLSRAGLDEALDMLLSRALQQGWRVMIRAPDRATLERLDAWLWLQPENGFLPHGLEGGGHEANQPVLLGQGAAVNGAQGIFLLGAMTIDMTEAAGMERVWLLFDGADEAQISSARVQWKAVAKTGLPAQYWNDASGRWEKKAETPVPSGS